MLIIEYSICFSDCEPSNTFPGNSAGSSSNSSLSTRSLDSPSTSLEQVHPTTSVANTSTSWDSDVDVEADPPDWSQAVAEDVLVHLSNSEKKRQEVINGEYFAQTEKFPCINAVIIDVTFSDRNDIHTMLEFRVNSTSFIDLFFIFCKHTN